MKMKINFSNGLNFLLCRLQVAAQFVFISGQVKHFKLFFCGLSTTQNLYSGLSYLLYLSPLGNSQLSLTELHLLRSRNLF